MPQTALKKWGVWYIPAMSFLSAFFVVLFSLFQASALPPIYSLKGKDLVSGQEKQIPANNLVVVFLSAKCPCSDSHIGEIADLARTYQEIQFIGVHSNADEDVEFAQEYFKKVQLPFLVIQDDDVKIADHFKALKTPHAFILDKKGNTIYQGGVTDSKDCNKSGRKYLREALEDLRQGRPIEHTHVRSLGCVIKRKK